MYASMAGRNPKYVYDKLIKEITKREKYLHDLRAEPLERKRVNEARKVDMYEIAKVMDLFVTIRPVIQAVELES